MYNMESRNLIHAVLCIGIYLAISACTSASGSSGGDSNIDPLISETALAASTDSNGQITFSFQAPGNISAFQLVVFTGTNSIKLVSLQNSNGAISLAALNSLFLGPTSPSVNVSTLNYPFTLDQISPGVYSATYQLVDAQGKNKAAEGVAFTAKLLTKSDTDLNSGTVRVNMILAGALSGSEDLQESLDSAMALVRAFMSTANLSLDVEWTSYPSALTLPNVRSGDAYYEALSSAVRPYAVNIIIGQEVSGIGGHEARYSVSSGDGSPAVPSARSVSAISLLRVAGNDGRFNFDGQGKSQVHDDEIRLAAEEIGQLIGHFLGLSHIVENDGNRSTGNDSLSDTASCVTLVDCREDKDARENLMFPFPLEVVGSNLDTYKRTTLTPQQKAILQSSVLVN
jgi:hypothetical protein